LMFFLDFTQQYIVATDIHGFSCCVIEQVQKCKRKI
jgi:hypothetical protein